MGVILFNLITGFLPFDGENFAVLYQKILKAYYTVPPYVSSGIFIYVGVINKV
jgi:hypothetical protein